MKTEIRTISQNGQVAIPKSFLATIGIVPPVKVRVIQERDAVIIRKSPQTRMSDKEFGEFLSRVRHRNVRVSRRQVEESIREVRRPR